MAATKEEKLLLALYHKESPHSDDIPLDPASVARAVGLSEKALKNSVNLLARANMLKKIGDQIVLTPHGRNMCQLLMRQQSNRT